MILKLGTRGSKLAVAQSSWVAEQIQNETGIAVELVIIKTRGDAILHKPLAEIGGKGLFTFELEKALRDGEIDFAVHSCKDLPTDDVEGLEIVCFPIREDSRDALVGGPLVPGLTIGTGSSRRQDQIGALEDVSFRGIRGNVDTRIAKMESGEYDRVVLAMAGINRVNIRRPDIVPLEVECCVPAPAQGALALQARKGDNVVIGILRTIHDAETECAVLAERRFMSELGGGCHSSLGAFVRKVDNLFEMYVFVKTNIGERKCFERGANVDALVSSMVNQMTDLY